MLNTGNSDNLCICVVRTDLSSNHHSQRKHFVSEENLPVPGANSKIHTWSHVLTLTKGLHTINGIPFLAVYVKNACSF